MKKLVYRLFLIVVFILRKMPRFIRRSFFKFIAYLGYVFAKKTNKVIEANLNLVFENSLSKDEIKDSKKYVVVVDFSGFLALKNHFGDRVKSVFIDCSEPERRKRAELRGDFNLDEWNRRYEDDKAKFPKKLISKHMDWILKTTKYSKEKSENDLKAISFLAENIGYSGEKND